MLSVLVVDGQVGGWVACEHFLVGVALELGGQVGGWVVDGGCFA